MDMELIRIGGLVLVIVFLTIGVVITCYQSRQFKTIIENLKRESMRLKGEYDYLQKRCDVYIEKYNGLKVGKNCLTLIDFSNIDILSIERTKTGQTSIGYWMDGPNGRETKEWIFDISTTDHDELVCAYQESTTKPVYVVGGKTNG